MPTKSLIGIPWRYAIRCIDELGLILRAEVIWSKPNGLPESVTDRVRRSHETWFHFTKEPRYYSAVDEVREPLSEWSQKALEGRWTRKSNAGTDPSRQDAISLNGAGRNYAQGLNPLGKLPGSVWTIDGGESITRSVLTAVAEGGITIEEGERILWAGKTNSGARWTSPATAGNGSASVTARATGATGEQARATDERTDSPTSSSRDLSLEGSASTTSAGTRVASTPTTSSPSLSQRTTHDDHARTDAQPGTPTTSGTPTSAATASESAEHAWQTASESAGGSASLPSVWVIPTEPLRVPEELGIDHFAAFPTEWPRRIITGWSPRGVCVECGEGRRPVVDRSEKFLHRPGAADRVGNFDWAQDGDGRGKHDIGNVRTVHKITGEACDCPEPTAPTTPGVVLDPFGGTGTTALVADALGRHGISVDMSADYCRLAEWRTSDPKQRAKAARKPFKPPVEQIDGQSDLLDMIEETA